MDLKVSEPKKLLRANQCTISREGSSHEIGYSPRTGKKFTVPRHNTQELPVGTVNRIKRNAGID